MQTQIVRNLNNITSGIHDLTSDEYHSSNGISRSGICQFMRSPLHYWETYLNPERVKSPAGEAVIFGSAFHTLVLEPHLFNREYAFAPKCDKRTTAGKAQWADFESQNFGKIILNEVDYDRLHWMRDSVMGDSEASQLILGAQYERSIYYQDEASGELCKARPDILHRHFACDLKTTVNASEHTFKRALVDYGYYIQPPMIFDAVEQILKTELEEFVFILVEKEPPYAVVCYPLDHDDIEFGRLKYRNELLKLAECRASNQWKRYESKVISLPQWARVL